MWSNYLKIALRNLSKRKAFSFINIAGPAIGRACALLTVSVQAVRPDPVASLRYE